jgi:hypothetical protein
MAYRHLPLSGDRVGWAIYYSTREGEHAATFCFWYLLLAAMHEELEPWTN